VRPGRARRVAPLVEGIVQALVEGVTEVGYATHPWARALAADCRSQPPDSCRACDVGAVPHPATLLLSGPL
jgi:hypothetical protein